MATSRGSTGGAADDTGTEYKRGVVAFVVACGLSGTQLPLDCLTSDEKRVAMVAAETDDPVDDVRVELVSGRMVYIQAKHMLEKGRPLTEAVKQWVKAAKSGLDRDRDRLVIASENLNGPMRTLGLLLERRRAHQHGALTADETTAAGYLDELLVDLTVDQQEDVWACGAIWHLEVRELSGAHTQNALAYLRHVVEDDGSDLNARRAWTELLQFAGKISRMRAGFTLSGWGEMLEGASIPLNVQGMKPSAGIVRRRRAVDAYLSEVIYRGTHIELRSLGGNLPDLALDEADAELEVSKRDDDERDAGELSWAFLRRHRAVLTGLPGGGKSTALRGLAAHFADDPQMPFPVYASLRNFHPSATGIDLLTHITSEATNIVSPDIAREVTDEIRDRITTDRPVALLLDSLDETYNRRHDVVSALSALVRQIPAGTAILLATRDVAYAQAKTLEWHDLRLMPPKSLDKPVRGILGLAAATMGVAEARRPEWIASRAEWADRVLSSDPVLSETPLFGALLALLASRRDIDTLPTSRGAILRDVVRDFILNRELSKRAELLELSADEAQHLGLGAFAVEAHVLLDAANSATETAVTTAIAAHLRVEWDFAPARSGLVADRIMHIFDEAGVFVIGSEDRVVSPRIALLAEVGDAMRAINDPDLEAWVQRRAAAEQYEPLILAFTLSDTALSAAVRLSDSTHTPELARAIATSVGHGATLDTVATRVVAAHLIDDLTSATMAGWLGRSSLFSLSLESDQVGALLARISALPVGYQHIIRSDAHIRWGSEGTPDEVLGLMRATLAIETLPVLRAPFDSKVALARPSETGIFDAQVRAARHMLELDPNTAWEIVERLTEDASYRLHERLWHLLLHHGNTDAIKKVRAIRAGFLDGVGLSQIPFNVDNYVRLLDLLGEEDAAPLTTHQRIATPNLSRLFSIMHMDATGSMHLVNADPTFLRELFSATTALYGIDRGVLSAEATVVRNRVRRWSTSALFGTMDDLEEDGDPDWQRVNDSESVADALFTTLRYAEPQAHFAARALAEGPPGTVVSKLETALETFANNPGHQLLVAHALAHASPDWEPTQWMRNHNPVLREAVIAASDPSDSLLRALIEQDPDRIVRMLALERLLTSDPSDAEAVREAAAQQEPVGWMCRSCCTPNPAAAKVCAKDGCRHAPPDWNEDPRTTRIVLGG